MIVALTAALATELYAGIAPAARPGAETIRHSTSDPSSVVTRDDAFQVPSITWPDVLVTGVPAVVTVARSVSACRNSAVIVGVGVPAVLRS